MTADQILDRILIPRPNGSEGLERVGAFLAASLESNGAAVQLQAFDATPYGFQLVWLVVLPLALAYLLAIHLRRYWVAFALPLVVSALLLAEFEMLWSPVSGLLTRTEHNVVGTFPGRDDGPLLVLSAHYDTATHFGDHFSWGTWGFRQGPATGLALALALTGLWLRRRGRALPRWATAAAFLVPLPFAAMFWFQSVGPLVRTPSPGAIDNGGAVAALLLLAQDLSTRPPDAAATVQIVFFAAEEERALGSRAFAHELDPGRTTVVLNLEAIGASDGLAYIPEDGFALRRYRSPEGLIDLVGDTARELGEQRLKANAIPAEILTDGRSFLAADIPALTLCSPTPAGFPRRLHSAHDSRDRLHLTGIARAVALLRAVVRRVDDDPSLLEAAS